MRKDKSYSAVVATILFRLAKNGMVGNCKIESDAPSTGRCEERYTWVRSLEIRDCEPSFSVVVVTVKANGEDASVILAPRRLSEMVEEFDGTAPDDRLIIREIGTDLLVRIHNGSKAGGLDGAYRKVAQPLLVCFAFREFPVSALTVQRIVPSLIDQLLAATS